MKLIRRKGTLMFWLIRKRLVIEFRLPIFIWKTKEKSSIIKTKKEKED